MSELVYLNIGEHKQKYNLTDFVETGCYMGNGISCALGSGFDNVYSCDIGENFVNDCRNKFPQANITHSESLQYLTDLLPRLNNRTLFWLDAHFPEYYGTNENAEKFRIPLITEMELIKELKPDYSNDVIICDDMRTFRSPHNPRYSPGEIEERFYLDVDWKHFINIFGDTHNHELIRSFDGVMLFYPK